MPTTKDDSGAAFAALKQPAVEALARVLYIKHATTKTRTLAACDTWLRLQRLHIAALHEVSIRRQGTLSLMADVFIRGAFSRPHEVLQAQSSAALCRHHRALNPRVLSALMALVVEEATVGADHVRAHLQEQKKNKRKEEEKTKQPPPPPPQQQQEDASEKAAECWLRNMSSIAVLWMGKTHWQDAMRRPLDVSVPPCARYRDCTACKLAVVGGSRRFLIDLRTSLLARQHLHEHEAREKRDGAADAAAPEPPLLLLRMVEAWIDRCYDERRQRHTRDESNLMVGVVAKSLGGGGAAPARREQGRAYTRGGWLMPKMQLRLEQHVSGGARKDGGDDDDDDDDEYVEEDGCVAGRGRWRQRTGPREGYSQYLPNRLIIQRADSIDTARALIGSSRAAERVAPASAYRPPVCVSENSSDDNAHDGGCDQRKDVGPLWPTTDGRRPSSPPQPTPPSPRRRSTDLNVDAAKAAAPSRNVPGEPWHADYERYILRSRSSLCSEALLSDIYDAYHDIDTAAGAGSRSSSSSSSSNNTSLYSPSSLFGHSVSGMAAAAAAAAASPPSPSEYSSVDEEEDTATQGRREDLPPPATPAHFRRPPSGIPVSKRMDGRRLPAVTRDRDGLMHMLSAPRFGGEGEQKRTAAMNSGRLARRD